MGFKVPSTQTIQGFCALTSCVSSGRWSPFLFPSLISLSRYLLASGFREELSAFSWKIAAGAQGAAGSAASLHWELWEHQQQLGTPPQGPGQALGWVHWFLCHLRFLPDCSKHITFMPDQRFLGGIFGGHHH